MTAAARSKPYRVGLIQMRCSADPDSNVRRAIELMGQAADEGASLICLPELFRSEYFCQTHDAKYFDLAEPIPGPTTEALEAFARTRGVVVIGSLFEKRTGGIYHNTSVVIEKDGSLVGRYRKMHIPHDPLYFEKYYFTPGDLGFKSFDTSVANVGTLVCWDQWYPEAARLTAMQGAEILVYPTAIGWHPGEKAEFGVAQADAWETMQRAHAISNGVFVAAINRVGHEGAADGGIEFWGGSFLADPFGRILARAGREAEEVVVAEVDPAMIEDTRRNWPFFRDRRVDAYGAIAQRWGV
ncbi:carbon-nitrogen hydrolase [Isosphaeraceae bacterium EP7]